MGICKDWLILDWNVRGLNSLDKCMSIRSILNNRAISIICFQETKRDHFDRSAYRRFAPMRFDQFVFYPSSSSTGGTFIGWVGSLFSGKLISLAAFQMMIEFTSKLNGHTWLLTSVYGPCQNPECSLFINWLLSFQILALSNWMFLGNFNLYRSASNRNKPGANVRDMALFNNTISSAGLLEIPLQDKNYTWSNMRSNSLLVQLDWCFTSPNWSSVYPMTSFNALPRSITDHCPCLLQIGTSIPKASIFCFENFWYELPGFFDLVDASCNKPLFIQNPTIRMAAKLIRLSTELRRWCSKNRVH
ncbi:hypothetical protein GUJ93_ZPchr0010g8169 [Zizania palustris]|uniref:Endonuclease/exonuclease/phosphatase domain-containing protein n=1 Tax=Zizania palustris TaxID=103762 RepID=A0A8J5VVS6_ZIZPA|nr:hypothetical protein GUJ93_ZPchr0010g8169 [Zizania palustris]